MPARRNENIWNLPFLMSSERERDQMLRIDPIAKVRAMAAKAFVFVSRRLQPAVFAFLCLALEA